MKKLIEIPAKRQINIIFNVLRIESNFDWMIRVLKHDINTFVML